MCITIQFFHENQPFLLFRLIIFYHILLYMSIVLSNICSFSACPVFVQRNDRIRAHFLICFLALFIYRLLEKKLERKYTCEELLSTLRDYEFADVQGQGFIPIYESTKLTDALHEVAGFETDYEFLTKRKMKEIQKLSKQPREKS